MKYKTIIFDFGGVLYNIDYFKSTRELAKLSSKPDVLSNLSHLKILELPAMFEKGLISEDEFRNYLRSEFYIKSNDIEIDRAWNAMLLGIKKESYSFISKIKDKYKLVLLSNTNSIHYEYFYPECKELMNLFDFVFLSYQIGKRKPDSEIFEYTLDKVNSKPAESVFIDDSEVNLKGAVDIGIDTIHFTEGLYLSDLLNTI